MAFFFSVDQMEIVNVMKWIFKAGKNVNFNKITKNDIKIISTILFYVTKSTRKLWIIYFNVVAPRPRKYSAKHKSLIFAHFHTNAGKK